MRRYSRRRSVTPFSISFVILVSATAAMAWYWKWIPWEFSSQKSAPTANVISDTAADLVETAENEPSSFTDEFGTELAAADGELDIFSAQNEPEITEIEHAAAPEFADDFAARDDVQAFRRERSQRPRRESRFGEDDLFGDDAASAGVRQIGFEEEADEAISDADEDLPPLRTANAARSRASGLRSTNERLTEIDSLIDNGEILAAHEKLSAWYFADPNVQVDLQERIDSTAEMLFFSPQPHIEEPYVVQPGDQLRKVAKQYHVPWEFIARVNRTDPRKIRAGQRLKVFTGPFTAEVDVSDYRLILKWKDLYVRSYLVGVGTKGSTPIGEFKVKDKLVDPVYYGSEGDVIANDDPANPLGERWIDLGDSYGIHGTIEPDSIGKAMSKGCIRMHNEQVEEVYDFLDVGSTVVIRP